MSNKKIHFILGGARSGKSRLAEAAALNTGLQVHYIATAENKDPEMESRIIKHKNDRPVHWLLTEEPFDLAEVIERIMEPNVCVLVDCLTLWLSNWLCSEKSDIWPQQKQKLLTVLQQASSSNCHVILVSNEVGHGIVPVGELSRVFVDESGWLHQNVAKIADKVDFVMAGLPLTLKNTSTVTPSHSEVKP